MKNVESELEDSSGKYETAAETNYNRDRRADAVRDVICDVTHMKWQFLGPRMETKNCNHARRDMEKPRQLTRVRASAKNTLRHFQAAQETQVWLLEKSFFYMMKMFEKIVQSDLEDSSGEYETGAERNSRDRRAQWRI